MPRLRRQHSEDKGTADSCRACESAAFQVAHIAQPIRKYYSAENGKMHSQYKDTTKSAKEHLLASAPKSPKAGLCSECPSFPKRSSGLIGCKAEPDREAQVLRRFSGTAKSFVQPRCAEPESLQIKRRHSGAPHTEQSPLSRSHGKEKRAGSRGRGGKRDAPMLSHQNPIPVPSPAERGRKSQLDGRARWQVNRCGGGGGLVQRHAKVYT